MRGQARWVNYSATASVFRQAFLLQQPGKLTEAEQLYLAVLQLDPTSPTRRG
jgi:hypothetical protein